MRKWTLTEGRTRGGREGERNGRTNELRDRGMDIGGTEGGSCVRRDIWRGG